MTRHQARGEFYSLRRERDAADLAWLAVGSGLLLAVVLLAVGGFVAAWIA